MLILSLPFAAEAETHNEPPHQDELVKMEQYINDGNLEEFMADSHQLNWRIDFLHCHVLLTTGEATIERALSYSTAPKLAEKLGKQQG